MRHLLLTLLAALLFPMVAVAQVSTRPAEAAPSGPGPAHHDQRTEEGLEIGDIELFELEVPTVVTATRRERSIATLPYAVSVITADDIRRAGARSVPEALRLAAGVDVAQLTFGQAAVSPRGGHGFLSNEVLVLVDGRQIFDSLFGGTLWGSWPFQIEDIARIEVIRSPGGVTWGANASKGVINIITKDPADQTGLTVTGGGGLRGTNKEHVGYAFADQKLKLRVSGEYEGSDGFYPINKPLSRLDDDYKAGRMGVHAIYQESPRDTFKISGGSAAVDGGFSPPMSINLGARKNAGTQASYLLGTWTHTFAAQNTLDLTGYVNDFYGSLGSRGIDYRYQQLALQLSHQFKPADEHTVSWGLDTRTDLVDATNADPFMLSKDFVSTAILGAYLQDEWRFAPRWALTLGGRIDYECYGGFQPSARAALSYELTDTSLVYGAVSRAFSMPPAAIRFTDLPILANLVRVTSDPNVRAQTLLAYEVGYRGRFFERLDVNLATFWIDSDDTTTLSFERGRPGLGRIDFDNRGAGALYGAELDARFAVTDRLTLLGNYTYQQLNWEYSEDFTTTEAIAPPRHKFMLGARYSVTDNLHLSSHLYYVDATRAPNPSNPFKPSQIDPYFRLDLRAEHEFWNDNASVAVGVSNLLDAGHREGGTTFMNDAEVPRMVYAEFRIRIK